MKNSNQFYTPFAITEYSIKTKVDKVIWIQVKCPQERKENKDMRTESSLLLIPKNDMIHTIDNITLSKSNLFFNKPITRE